MVLLKSLTAPIFLLPVFGFSGSFADKLLEEAQSYFIPIPENADRKTAGGGSAAYSDEKRQHSKTGILNDFSEIISAASLPMRSVPKNV